MHSSSGSTSSQDDLEMRAARPLARSAVSADSVHRLHPSSRRRSSETSTERRVAVTPSTRNTGSASTSRDSRPPPSMRGFSHIPPYTEPSPITTGALPGSLSTYQLSGSSSRRGSATSLSSPLGGQVSASAPGTPGAITPSGSEFSFGLTPNFSLEGSYSTEPAIKPGTVSPSVVQNDRRVPKTARISDLERIDSLPESTRTERSRKGPKEAKIVNVLPEPVQPSEPEPELAPAKGSKKLSKGSGKLVKKSHRWSSSKATQITV